MPGVAAVRSIGFLTVLGALAYGAPLYVWLRYSERIVSAGGLAAFVEAAVGRRVALVQAAVWAFSYFLYLPYTVTDIVYEMLVVVFPGIAPWRWLLELTVPLALIGIVLAGTIPALRVLMVSAVAQLVVLLALGAILIAHVGAPGRSFTRVPDAHAWVHGGAGVALLFVCGSLPLFLAAEVVGGSRTVRRSLLVAWVVVAAYLAFGVFAYAATPLRGDIPGYVVASTYSGRTLGVVVGLGAAISVAGLIVAEYLALSRLLFSETGIAVRKLLVWIAVPFVAIDALSLIDPDKFDKDVLRPSLVALYLSQLIVFAVYPRFRGRKLTPVDVALASLAFAVMAWGLWRAVIAPVST